MKRFIVAGMLALSIALHAAKVKDSDWQTGTLREVRSHSATRAGGIANGRTALYSSHEVVTYEYVIDAPPLAYTASEELRGRRKPLLATVHGPIRFAVEGHTLYVQDEEGKTQKLNLVLKEAK